MTKRWITDRKNRTSHKYSAIHVQLMHEMAQKRRAAALARKVAGNTAQLALFASPTSTPPSGQNAGQA